MPVRIALLCWRVPATASTPFVAPSLSMVLRVCRTQRRYTHTSTSKHTNVPPPLTATPLRRSTAHHGTTPRRASSLNSTSTAAASSACATAVPRWTDGLALAPAGAAPSRVALGETASLCLAVESPKCYAVYRPCDGDEGSALHGHAAPHHFVELLAHLRRAPSLSVEARRVAEVLVDLLNKPPHPSYPGPWDVPPHALRTIKADAIAHVLECVPAGDDALAWLAGLLGLTDVLVEADPAASASLRPAALLTMAAMERLESRDAATERRVRVDDPDGDWLLSRSPAVVGGIAAAMLRSSADGARADALVLLEAAARARLTCGTDGVPSGGRPDTAADLCGASGPFNEAVAVHCAEVAAVRGDVEAVTRLIFLLYRARGALAFATLAEHRQQRRTSRGKLRWGVGGLLPRTPAWMSATWWSGSGDGGGTAFPAAGIADDDADARFEQAVVRLLRSVMHAALYHPSRSGDPADDSVAEALSLWDGLRGGTSWSGLAAMAAELLTYLVGQHALLTAAGCRDDGAAANARLQQAGLRVYTQLCRAAATPRHRTPAQQEVLHHCTTLLMRLLSISAAAVVETGTVAVPTVVTSTAAECVLRLFAAVEDAAQREALLPYALAASLTLFSITASLKSYQPPAALFSGLVRYFAEVQSLHFYCVASDGAASASSSRVAVCGSLTLLHVFLLSHTPLGAWAREDGELWSLVQRLGSLDGVGEGSGGGVQHRDEQNAQLLAWLRVSGTKQRQLLWSLLMSLKRRGPLWCGATVNLFASPASSAAVFAAAAATYTSLSGAELRTVMSLLYECGNTDDPVHAAATLDEVVSASAQMPVRTLTLAALAEQLQRKSTAGGARVAVLVLTDASLRAIAHRCDSPSAPDVADPFEALVSLLQPLLRESATHPPPSAVSVVLTPACLMELQRLHAQRSAAVVATLHAALTSAPAHQLYQVAVASSWPLLPSVASALRQHSDLCGTDGLREATAAARHLAEAFPKESRPVVCLWAEEEEETSPSTPNSLSAVRVSLLQHYGAREVSTHRAHVEKAKNDIFSLLRASSTAGSRPSDLHVPAEVAAAESNAARRVRNESLLSAVSHKRKGQRTL